MTLRHTIPIAFWDGVEEEMLHSVDDQNILKEAMQSAGICTTPAPTYSDWASQLNIPKKSGSCLKFTTESMPTTAPPAKPNMSRYILKEKYFPCRLPEPTEEQTLGTYSVSI